MVRRNEELRGDDEDRTGDRSHERDEGKQQRDDGEEGGVVRADDRQRDETEHTVGETLRALTNDVLTDRLDDLLGETDERFSLRRGDNGVHGAGDGGQRHDEVDREHDCQERPEGRIREADADGQYTATDVCDVRRVRHKCEYCLDGGVDVEDLHRDERLDRTLEFREGTVRGEEGENSRVQQGHLFDEYGDDRESEGREHRQERDDDRHHREPPRELLGDEESDDWVETEGEEEGKPDVGDDRSEGDDGRADEHRRENSESAEQTYAERSVDGHSPSAVFRVRFAVLGLAALAAFAAALTALLMSPMYAAIASRSA